jgi:hypothetical protein
MELLVNMQTRDLHVVKEDMLSCYGHLIAMLVTQEDGEEDEEDEVE